MIYQMQHQFKDGTTEMKMQREFKKSDEKNGILHVNLLVKPKKNFLYQKEFNGFYAVRNIHILNGQLQTNQMR